MNERELLAIITYPCVELLREHGVPLDSPTIRFYPDGSLIVSSRDIPRTWELLNPVGSSLFRSLAFCDTEATPASSFSVLFPATFDLMGQGENWVLMRPGVLQALSPLEEDSSRVFVFIRLRRKLTPSIAAELVSVFKRWFITVGSRGVFGEAGIKSLPPRMQYLDKCAAFVLDGSGSGQHTLNTLYLAVLNWAMELHRPLVMLDLTGKPDEPAFSSEHSVPFE